MKKNEIFTFTAPNGAKVTAVVLDAIHVTPLKANDGDLTKYLCYAQNRLFTYFWVRGFERVVTHEWIDEGQYGEVLVDYCILPDYDAMLDRYSEIQQAQAETNLGM